MKRIPPIVACIVASLLTSWINGQEDGDFAGTIPLSHIWADNMPGSRSVRELEPKHNYDQLPSAEELTRDSLVARIQHALSRRPTEGEVAGSAFVVVGIGKEALKRASEVLTGKLEPAQVLPSNTDLTLVFYSYRCGQYVWLDSVNKSGNQVSVRYRFVAHRTREATTHFALIPLGSLPVGAFRVEIEELPPVSLNSVDSVTPVQDARQIVCDSFSFQVGE